MIHSFITISCRNKEFPLFECLSLHICLYVVCTFVDTIVGTIPGTLFGTIVGTIIGNSYLCLVGSMVD